ncbi:hypothetical protein FACS1894202_13350 [Clostridia bacterium]|nr:hypothetical protein FACS1894202_13350 [Clostridia bacterium]
MLTRFALKNEGVNEDVGRLCIDYESDLWHFVPNHEYKGEQPWFIRVAEMLGRTVEKEDIKTWVLNRAPEQNADWIDKYCDMAGLQPYDPYGFFLFNKGHFVTDSFYVEVEG